jgi:hypothetical protein
MGEQSAIIAFLRTLSPMNVDAKCQLLKNHPDIAVGLVNRDARCLGEYLHFVDFLADGIPELGWRCPRWE